MCYNERKKKQRQSLVWKIWSGRTYMSNNILKLDLFMKSLKQDNLEFTNEKFCDITESYSILTELLQLKDFVEKLNDEDFESVCSNFENLVNSYSETFIRELNDENPAINLSKFTLEMLTANVSDSCGLNNIYKLIDSAKKTEPLIIKRGNLSNFKYIIDNEKITRELKKDISKLENKFSNKLLQQKSNFNNEYKIIYNMMIGIWILLTMALIMFILLVGFERDFSDATSFLTLLPTPFYFVLFKK